MFLSRVLQSLCRQRLQSSDNSKSCIAWLDDIVDITVARDVVRVRELIVVLLLLLATNAPSPLHSQTPKEP